MNLGQFLFILLWFSFLPADPKITWRYKTCNESSSTYLFTTSFYCLQCLLTVISWHSSLTFGPSLSEHGTKLPAMLPACVSWFGLRLSSTAALQMETSSLTLSDCRSNFLVLSAPASLHSAVLFPLSATIKYCLQRTWLELCSAVQQQTGSHHLPCTQCGQLGRRQDWIPSHNCYELGTENLKPEKSQWAPKLSLPTPIKLI